MLFDMVLILILLLVLAFAGTLWWGRRYVNQDSADEEFNAETKDGVLLPIWRYRPDAPSRRFPVVLCHGLAATRFNLDLSEDLSLARYLRKQGYDIYVPELRGSAAGMALNPKASRPDYWNFCFDDHAQFDVPAIVEAVMAKSGREKVHWIGHSMGGMVVFASVGQGVTENLASLTSLGSPSSFAWAVSRTKLLARVGSALRWTRAPLPELGRFTLFGAIILRWLVWKGPFNGRNIHSKDLLRAFANLPNYVSACLLRQVHSWMLTGVFSDSHGRDYLEDYKQGRCPALFFAGAADSVADPRSVRIGYERWGHSDKVYYELGRKFGHDHDYGHVDLTIGSKTPTEVYPEILSWLNRHDH